ncbi:MULTISPECIES: autoinducer binding domain-containing protein [unclassified Mesorhizobium]|uniref:autoinducer binding domain-containing protein n=1 Tax=unclassified Mesorhizobium TaxID=325217 RepID=UPI001FE1A081|nr:MULTISPECIES: autoinducer binding domain-containing protein [unclassified Mesorhizobium]MCT2581098.1 autoinducer binding domain-containing protein [Mesorhizobium sp. P13.3]MDF3170142.1 autoinducer binding domain-containing protein [Mesorhizobium sp. P16.1]MDF3181088.1 autoinducer binding domain-containing protein [Mesorhizobium sp. P17.1]MDF3187011.1 autoinducer binding domain-containing protein [Mesorhizobium sp. ICCV3110.1]
MRARCGGCPFRWGSDMRGFATSQVQQRLFEEAAEFGIRCGFQCRSLGPGQCWGDDLCRR